MFAAVVACWWHVPSLCELALDPCILPSALCLPAAGLPLAVLAIFGSEPDSSPKALLRRGMGELLAGAGDTRAESWPR